jgi:hypothetical protein
MIKSLNRCGIVVENSLLNADKGFDCKMLRRADGEILSRISKKTNETERKPNGEERDFLMKIYSYLK